MTSLIHLQAIWRFKQKELDKEILSFIERWNTEHKCNCCKNWKRGDEEIECVHLEKKINKNFGKRIDYQYYSLILDYQTFYLNL